METVDRIGTVYKGWSSAELLAELPKLREAMEQEHYVTDSSFAHACRIIELEARIRLVEQSERAGAAP